MNKDPKMIDRELIEKLKLFKEEHRYTLHEMSKKIDIQVSTLERWLKTGRINKVYADVVRGRLGIK
jgi:predicted DNA-binding protein (UPF0251 family)